MNLSFGKCNGKRQSEKVGMGNWERNEGNDGNDGIAGNQGGNARIGVGIISQINL